MFAVEKVAVMLSDEELRVVDLVGCRTARVVQLGAIWSVETVACCDKHLAISQQGRSVKAACDIEASSISPCAGCWIVQLRQVGNVGKIVNKETAGNQDFAIGECRRCVISAGMVEIACCA